VSMCRGVDVHVTRCLDESLPRPHMATILGWSKSRIESTGCLNTPWLHTCTATYSAPSPGQSASGGVTRAFNNHDGASRARCGPSHKTWRWCFGRRLVQYSRVCVSPTRARSRRARLWTPDKLNAARLAGKKSQFSASTSQPVSLGSLTLVDVLAAVVLRQIAIALDRFRTLRHDE
jgi:hypothetical protein